MPLRGRDTPADRPRDELEEEEEETVRYSQVHHQLDVRHRMAIAQTTFGSLSNIWTEQALTLGLWVQWPGGPVDLKTYWPPKKLTGPGGQ